MINTRQKLGALVRRFLKFMDDGKRQIFQISTLIQESSRIFKDQRKALDIIFLFEGLGLILRISEENVIYVGLRGMASRLHEHQILNFANEPKFDEIIVEDKSVNVRPHVLGGQLIASIFFPLICDIRPVSKSIIEEAVETFALRQKDFIFKNFAAEMLNLLAALSLIDKNEATEVIAYTGPDLHCYDEKSRKISWKLLELDKFEDNLLGKETTESDTLAKSLSLPTVTGPAHISFFPELCYAVLRADGWEKPITSTVFIIGRNGAQGSRSSHKVDLDLPYKSVSRQHAAILFNYEAERWELRVLSRKNLVRIDGERFAWRQKNVWLKHRCEIEIGQQKMFFLEAKKHNID